VLYDTVFYPRFLRQARESDCLLCGESRRFFAVHVFTRLDCPADALHSPIRRLSVEIDRHVLTGKRFVKVGRPIHEPGLNGKSFELIPISADEQWLWHDHGAVTNANAALVDDGANGSLEVLVGPHPTGHPIHDDSDSVYLVFRHGDLRFVAPGQLAGWLSKKVLSLSKD